MTKKLVKMSMINKTLKNYNSGIILILSIIHTFKFNIIIHFEI